MIDNYEMFTRKAISSIETAIESASSMGHTYVGTEHIILGFLPVSYTHLLGFGRAQTFFHIILPQVIKRIVPASSNEVVILVKDTSLANIVAYAEITLKAQQQMQIYSSLTPLFIAGVFYFIISMIMTVIFAFIERKLNYYK